MPQKHAISDGFTLLELLMAMTVAVIIIGLTTLIYRDGDAAWTAGVQRAERDAAARAAIQIISRDLRHAIADEYFVFAMDAGPLPSFSYQFKNSIIDFITLQHDEPGSNRTARAVEYWVRQRSPLDSRFELMRNEHKLSPPSESSGVIAGNVAGFALLAGGVTNAFAYNSTHYTNRLPEYVDIFLELLDERSAGRAARMTNETEQAEQAEFVDRNARRYTTRVYLRNRHAHD